MPTDDIALNPKIKVIFKGFIVTRIRDGAAEAMVGALAASPCHRPKIYVVEIAPGKPEDGGGASTIRSDLTFDITQNLRLQVEDSVTGIQEYQVGPPEFNRLDDENDPKDFRWFVDLDDLHKPRDISIDESVLIPRFTLNKGIFHTSNLSDYEVRTQRHNATVANRFGRYAQEITARIVFDRADARAVLTNGTKEVLVIPPDEARRNFRYEIVFDCDCRVESTEGDFGLVYRVIRGLIVPDETFELVAHRSAVVDADGKVLGISIRNPEVYCTGGNNHGGG